MQGRVESSGDIRITESGNHQDELNVTIHDMEFGRRNVGIWGTAFNIFKCFVGIGLLALPSAFHHVRMGNINLIPLQIGIIGGAIGIILIGVINYFTMMMQVKCKVKYESSFVETYSDLAYVIFGKWGKFTVDVSLYTS